MTIQFRIPGSISEKARLLSDLLPGKRSFESPAFLGPLLKNALIHEITKRCRAQGRAVVEDMLHNRQAQDKKL
jgi:hypothetical protein